MSASLCFSNANKTHTVNFSTGPEEMPTGVRLDEKFEFNVGNANARDICSALGFSRNFEEISFEVSDLQGACERFLNSEIASLIDGEREPEQFGNVIKCGRRAGYLTEKVEAILEATIEATRLGATHASLG